MAYKSQYPNYGMYKGFLSFHKCILHIYEQHTTEIVETILGKKFL